MESLKEICNQYSKWKPLEDYVLRIETYKEDNGVIVLENCKSLVESICKTILHDLGESIPRGETIQNLVSKACNKMACLPNTGELARSFITVARRLGEFRNSFSEVGHGHPVYELEENRNKITQATIRFMMNSVEQLSLFLISVYQTEYPQHVQRQARYEDNPDFNELFDDQFEPIQIGEYGPYSPSEVLFNIDSDAYRTELVANEDK